MRVTAVSSAGHPGRPNEDFTGAVPGAAVLDLDRADAPLVVTDPREVVISGSYEPALEAAAGTPPRTGGSCATCAPTATRPAASGWPRTTRGRRTRPSPAACRSPG
ncbi:hypothetical protein [Nonomuraea coxensis]|uniref:hypothetical protein n=1 Tax=Nonomuraea coxensis TaxID=404386 RepID=UPI0012FB5623|nr:hypothetical protein [Nonomuraea coxensis]